MEEEEEVMVVPRRTPGSLHLLGPPDSTTRRRVLLHILHCGAVLRLVRTILLRIAGPEGEVVTQELHDEGRVLVRIFTQAVELGDGVVERILGELARRFRLVVDLVVKDRGVEGLREAAGSGAGSGGQRGAAGRARGVLLS